MAPAKAAPLLGLESLRMSFGPILDSLAQSGQAIAIADHRLPDAPLVFVNAAFETLTGYASDEVLGRNCRFLQAPDVDPAARALVRSALAEKRPVTVEIRNARKDGSTFWNRLHLTPLTDADGATAFYLAAQNDVTYELARAQAEQELQAVQARVAEGRDLTPLARAVRGAVGAWEWDVLSGRLYADARFAELCSLDPVEAAAGLPTEAFFSSVHPDDHMRVRIAVAGIMRGTEILSKVYRVVAPNGSARWVSAQGRAERGTDEKLIRFSGILADVTEQKRAEEKLRIAQKAGGIGTFEFTSGFGTVDVSEQFCQLLGLHPTDALPVRTINAVVHPGDPPLIGVQGEGELGHREFRIIRPDNGETRFIARRGERQRDGNTTGHRFIGAIYDITSFKEVEDKLRVLSETLEAQVQERTKERDRVWSNSRDLLAVIDSAGVFRSANPAWRFVLGFEPQDLVGSSILDRLDVADEAGRIAVRAIPAFGLTDLETRCLHRDGSLRWIVWNTSNEGDLVYAYGRDVTAEKARAEVLRQTEEQLRQSQKMEAVGQLTGGIAHDFNNMLTGIIGGIQVVRSRISKGRTGEVEPIMDAVVVSAQRAASLVHRLLAFSRRQPLDPQAVDASALVASMEDLLRRTLGEQIQLRVAADPATWSAWSDANQLENAILNLAINARDAMPTIGTLTIATGNARLSAGDVAGHPGLKIGDYVEVSVTDTGEGMPPEVVAKAFDPFFTTKPIGQGTGLGLSMIYGFMQQTGGHVTIDSALGRGTTIRLFLPRDLGATGAADTAAPVSPITAPRGSGESILVVEDDISVRLLMTEVLVELGYAVLTASDSTTALPILAADGPIDLLISDIGLPGMDGRELAEQARRHRPNLKVLFVTGYAAKAAVRSELLDPGMDLISKPFEIDAFGAKVRQMIQS
jgi:PAS domain S-box-containing protein